MTLITDSKGNVIREEPETLEDWKQAAQVEARIRRELQDENRRLRGEIESWKELVKSYERKNT